MALTIRLCCFFCILALILARPPIFYVDDYMGWQEKVKICDLSKDLLKDSLLKMRQIVDIRHEHEDKVAYNLGMLMGRVREKYRFMLETYRDAIVSFHNWSRPRPPGVKFFRPFHFVISLEMIHYLELEIDKLVDIFNEEAADDILNNRDNAGEEIEKAKKKKNNGNVTSTPRTPPPRVTPKLLRGGANRHEEEAEKSLMRQRFMMKKLGYPTNMTTMKKRFLRHWPVEDSWPLDKYNYNY